jgi:hypothetical protein
MSDNGGPVRDRQWLLALLPVFPLVLLVLRLWYLSRQDIQTMLLLLQYVSSLGLISTLLITLLWAVPVVILVTKALGGLLRVSTPDAAPSWLARASAWIPDWVVLLAAPLAALIWQLRFLPALAMVLLAILGLEARIRHGAGTRLAWIVCVALPLVVAAAAYSWMAPAIAHAIRAGEVVTAMLLMIPPGLTALLTGPVPARAARLVTHWAATLSVPLFPFVLGAIFLRAPVLPTVALEVDAEPKDGIPPQVVIGQVITVDDTMTTVLDRQGTVRFVPNGQLVSKTLCPDAGQAPNSVVDVHGWLVEQTWLNWMAPAHTPSPPDPRCQGRPLIVAGQ